MPYTEEQTYEVEVVRAKGKTAKFNITVTKGHDVEAEVSAKADNAYGKGKYTVKEITPLGSKQVYY